MIVTFLSLKISNFTGGWIRQNRFCRLYHETFKYDVTRL